MTEKTTIDLNDHWNSAQSKPRVSPPKCDVDKYLEYLKDFDLSDEERVELLNSIWQIMATFVDLGFGVDSIQLLSFSSKPPAPDSNEMGEEIKQDSSKGVIHVDE